MTANIICALPIPFHANGDVDWPTYRQLLEELSPSVDSFLVAGTTAEFPALDEGERVELFRVAADVIGAQRVIAHVGHASAVQVIALMEHVRGLQIEKVAVLTPYYLPTDQEGVVDFYRQVSEARGGLSIYTYLFPERTGIDIDVRTFKKIMSLPGVIGTKLSGAANARLAEYASELTTGQELYSGADDTLPTVLSVGGHGVVSGVSAVFPEAFVELVRALRDSDPDKIDLAQATVVEAVKLVGPSIALLKEGRRHRDGGAWASRMAMPAVPDLTAKKIESLVAEYTQ